MNKEIHGIDVLDVLDVLDVCEESEVYEESEFCILTLQIDS